MLELEYDEGWDKELVPGGKGIKFKNLDRALVDKGLVIYYDGNTYIFLTGSNVWATFVSAEAQTEICAIVGSDNVSVNYLPASEPFIDYLESHANRIAAIPTSICVGTRRKTISLEENRMHFRDCDPIAAIMEGAGIDDRVSLFCNMPCKFPSLPKLWENDGPGRLERYMLPLFSDQRELLTLKWLLGGIPLDPAMPSKFLILYGNGGTGKSTILKIIRALFKGCCSTIPSGTFTSVNSDVPLKTAQIIASNRIVTSGELDLEKKRLNLHIIKEMTGHDCISVPPVTVTTRCTLVAATNYLPDPAKQSEWCTPQLARRSVVIPFSVNAEEIPKVQRPDTLEDVVEFLLSCIYTRLTVPDMPMSSRSILYTILGEAFNKITHSIEEVESPTMQETLDANTLIESAMGLEPYTLGKLAALITNYNIVSYYNHNFINFIRVRSQK
jgi:hypothetical protein